MAGEVKETTVTRKQVDNPVGILSELAHQCSDTIGFALMKGVGSEYESEFVFMGNTYRLDLSVKRTDIDLADARVEEEEIKYE